MAISKKLRYEVLKRDNFACRYCGAFAPIVVLHIDHVVPRKLGGSDKPENLVTACQDCNSGKSDSAPPSSLVAEVRRQAREWKRSGAGEDGLEAMAAYQDALYLLEELPGDAVLRCIAQVFIDGMPYRPAHDELIRAAAIAARNAEAIREACS